MKSRPLVLSPLSKWVPLGPPHRGTTGLSESPVSGRMGTLLEEEKREEVEGDVKTQQETWPSFLEAMERGREEVVSFPMCFSL